MSSADSRADTSASVSEIFTAFLTLGLTSFGGPIAHLAYFRTAFVEQREWLSEARFAQLLALCQFLPGPASSQLGFAIGLLRGGWLGALAAFVGFTLPSVVLLLLFAALLPALDGPLASAALHGLKLVALVVVAHGLMGMARNLCRERFTASIAAVTAAILLVTGPAWIALLLIVLAAAVGSLLPIPVSAPAELQWQAPLSRHTGGLLLLVFGVGLIGLSLFAGQSNVLGLSDAFYRSGALVFGGGHVVLPLLQDTVVAPGWVSESDFLAGYGAAQAVPGPLFSFAAYLGAQSSVVGGLLGAFIAVLAIFIPGFLLLAGLLPWWGNIAQNTPTARAVAAVNAAVVGLLAAALYDPIWINAIRTPLDLAIAIIGFVLLAAWRLSALWVVAWCVTAAMLFSLN
ncbi:MAG: chromate efflux transporter [Wenzhouxiangellaceae bacterium]